jgi:ankyrin repeat protein
LNENRVYHTKANNGTTPLHMACKNGSLDIVKYLVEKAQINRNESKDGERGKLTPLAFAVAKGNFEIAQYLINKKAQITSHVFYLSCKHGNAAF